MLRFEPGDQAIVIHNRGDS